MISILIRRIVSLVVTLLVVSLLIFSVMNLLPGDPAAIMLGTSATPETLAALRAQMGLDEPIVVRYVAWLMGMMRGISGSPIPMACRWQV